MIGHRLTPTVSRCALNVGLLTVHVGKWHGCDIIAALYIGLGLSYLGFIHVSKCTLNKMIKIFRLGNFTIRSCNRLLIDGSLCWYVFALEFKPSKEPGWPWMLWILNHALTRFEYWCVYYIQSWGRFTFIHCLWPRGECTSPSVRSCPTPEVVFFQHWSVSSDAAFQLLGEVTVPICIATKFQLNTFSNNTSMMLYGTCISRLGINIKSILTFHLLLSDESQTRGWLIKLI